ncbi:MAG: hypothetical protein ACTHQE_11420 [Thermomicrobiales bacterium]
MTSRIPSTPSTRPEDSRDDARSPLLQALPLLLSVAVTLGLTLAFVAGQWLATGGSALA